MRGIRRKSGGVSKSRPREAFTRPSFPFLQRSPVEKRSGSLLFTAMPLNVAHVENVQHPGERARVFYANVDLRERLSYARLTMSSFQRHGGAIFLTVVSSSSDSGRRGEGLGHVREFRRATLLNLSLSLCGCVPWNLIRLERSESRSYCRCESINGSLPCNRSLIHHPFTVCVSEKRIG